MLPVVGSKTPVSLLQEYAIRQRTVPDYIIREIGGESHNPTFQCTVTVGHFTAVKEGRSKAQAKHLAASNLLDLINVRESPEVAASFQGISAPQETYINYNAVGELSQYCFDNRHPQPTYELTEDVGPAHARVFTVKCNVSQLSETGQSRTKKQAKQISGYNMLRFLKQQDGEQINSVVKYNDSETKQEIPIDVDMDVSKPVMKPMDYLVTPVTKYSEYGQCYMNMCQGSTTLLRLIETGSNKLNEDDMFVDTVNKICEELHVTLSEVEVPVMSKNNDEECLVIFKVNMNVPLCSIGRNKEETSQKLISSMKRMMRC